MVEKLVRDNYENIIKEKDLLRKSIDSQERFLFYRKKILEELKELEDTVYNDPFEYANLIESI